MTYKSRRNLIVFMIVVLLIGGLGLAYGALVSDRRAQVAEAAKAGGYSEDLTLVAESGTITLKVALAVDPRAQERGMMFRTAVGNDQGMLFVFPDVANRAFWMKNTLIPLDLIFLDAGRQVLHIAHDAKPEDESLILSQLPAKYVLEVAGGQAAAWGLKEGGRGKGAAFDRGDTLALEGQPALSQQPAVETLKPGKTSARPH